MTTLNDRFNSIVPVECGTSKVTSRARTNRFHPPATTDLTIKLDMVMTIMKK